MYEIFIQDVRIFTHKYKLLGFRGNYLSNPNTSRIE